MEYKSLLDYPKENNPVLIRDGDSTLGIYIFFKELNGLENIYAKQGDLHNFIEVDDPSIYKNWVWHYFEKIPRNTLEEICRFKKKLTKEEAKKSISCSLKRWIDLNCLNVSFKKLKFPTYCFLIGDEQVKSLDIISNEEISKLLEKILYKEFFGEFVSDCSLVEDDDDTIKKDVYSFLDNLVLTL
jgi:hypothetical protein